MPSSHLLQFIGGLTFFFFGLYTMHRALTGFAGERFRNIIARTTEGRFKSLATGMVVTFFLQSSSAVTVMTVGLASSGLITLEQAMAIGLGAGVGTTFVVLIMSVKTIVSWGLFLIVAGLLLKFLESRKKSQLAGDILFGFGFVFFGMTVMSEATRPLQTYPLIPQIFLFMEQYPFANFAIAALITALVHSSAVVLGILISLAYSGSITFPVAVPLVLGANIGTSFTAVLAAFKAKTEGKRTAWANLLLRLLAVLILAPFFDFAAGFFHQINVLVLDSLLGFSLTVHSEIALSHLVFNLFIVVLFLPLLPVGKRLIERLIPRRGEEEAFGPKYLDKNALATPALAFAQINREILRAGEIVQTMFRESVVLFERYDLDAIDRIESEDHKVDTLYKAVKFYLAKLSIANLNEEEADTSLHAMSAINELENIGDTIDHHILRLAQTKWNKGVDFSPEGWQEITALHGKTADMIGLTLAALGSASEELARRMERHFEDYVDEEDRYKMAHLLRLHQGLKESIHSSSIHLELVALFHRINLSLLTMVRQLLPEKRGENK